MHLPATNTTRPPGKPAGRAFNRLLLGTFSRSACLPNEDLREWDRLAESYVQHFDPQDEVEAGVVAEMFCLERRRRRLERAENALLAEAAEKAQDHYPDVLTKLAREVHAQEIEVGLLRRLLDGVSDVFDEEDTGRAEARLRGVAGLLEGLVGWPIEINHWNLGRTLGALATTVQARETALESSRETLKALWVASKAAVEAAQAEAGLLDAKLLARLRQEQTTVCRAVERQLKILGTLRGGVEFEGTLAIARGHFHDSRLSGSQEVAA